METTKILSVAKIQKFLIIKTEKMKISPDCYLLNKIHTNKTTWAIRIIGTP